MRLENIVWDARDPHLLGRFWASALGAVRITDEPDLVEARVLLTDDVFLDLCFPRVATPSPSTPRLHLELSGGPRPDEVVARLLAFGARPADRRGEPAPGTLLSDPGGGTFRVGPDHDAHRTTGPLSVVALESADPGRDGAFWADITGWAAVDGVRDVVALRHPGGVGPHLRLRPESGPKLGKNRVHLDVRREDGEDDVVEHLLDLGASALSAPGDHPWRVFTDPSGNEFCVLG